MKKIFFAVLLGVSALVPFAAHAEGNYVKLGVGRSEYMGGGLDTIRGTSATLGIGVDLDKTWDLELGYINFGNADQTITNGPDSVKNSIKSQSVYLAVIGKVPAGANFSFLGKAGLAITHTKLNSTSTIANVTASESDSITRAGLLIGAGAAYQFTKDVAATLDYTYFIKPGGGDSKISLVTLGLNYSY